MRKGRRERPVKAEPAPAPVPRKRGRPRKDEVRPPKAPTRIERQAAGMPLSAMLADLPTVCDVGTKRIDYRISVKGFRIG